MLKKARKKWRSAIIPTQFFQDYKITHIAPKVVMVEDIDRKIFFSYSEPIVLIRGDTMLVSTKKFSRTTSKHQNMIIEKYGKHKKIIEV